MMLLESFWFLMPAFFATIAPVFARRTKFLDFPVDLNMTLWGKPVFGKNKTFRGFFFGIIASVFIANIQGIFYIMPFFQQISILDYAATDKFLLGFLMGFGALSGDLAKSFFKRRLDIGDGETWIPFDQVDYAIGSVLFVFPWVRLNLFFSVYTIIVGGISHYIAVAFSYKVGLRKD